MAMPLARHWYRRVTGAGPQVRGTAVNVDPILAVPLIVGTGAERTPAATLAVAAEVFAADVYPALEPVTVTVIAFPRSAAAGLYVPPRRRDGDTVGPPLVGQADGGRSPGARRARQCWDPTLAVPLMVGAGAVSTGFAAMTIGVAGEVFAVVVYPALEPVTATVIVFPRSVAVGLYVLAVAPVMTVLLARHW